MLPPLPVKLLAAAAAGGSARCWPGQTSEDFVGWHVLKLPLQVGSGAGILLFRMLPPLLNDGDNESAASG